MILLKLGGSVITNKARPLSPRRKAVDGLAWCLGRIGEPVVVVHGGGSYGHHWSVKYDMHTKPKKYAARGVAVVKTSMVELNRIVLNAMLRNGLNPYCLPPTDFMHGGTPVEEKIREIGRIARSGLIPVTFGDALWHGRNRTYILSGDRIMTHLAGVLKPRLCVFALNEDGLYDDLGSKRLVREFRGGGHTARESPADVTGGMARKVEEATRISGGGTKVFFANGFRPERIVNAVKNNRFEGTLFRGMRHG